MSGHPPPPRPPAATTRAGRARAAHPGAAMAAALLVATLSGCGLRLESLPPALPTPDAAETARQSAVERSLDLSALGAAALDGSTGAAADALARVTTDADAHAAALGGLWAPPAWATEAPPSSGPTPSDGPTPPTPPASPTDVLTALGAAAEQSCADAVAVEPADLATLLTSVCLAQDDAAAALAAAVGTTAPTALGPDAAPSPTGLPDDVAAALGAAPGAAAVARSLDAAGFALEVAAARSDDGRRDQVAALAAAHRAAARDVLAAAGLLGTADDPRRAAYQMPPDADGAPLGMVAVVPAVEADLTATWAAALGDVPPAARPALLAEAGRAWTTARAWGAPSSAFPGLPGSAAP